MGLLLLIKGMSEDSMPLHIAMNTSTLSTAASLTFGLAINTLIGLDLVPFNLSSDEALRSQDTILLRAAPPDYPPAVASPTLEMALLQRGALYAAVGALLLYLLAIPLVCALTARKKSAWRPPRDLMYPANAVCMVYDSSLVQSVAAGREGWERARWGFGVFRGSETGEWRVGIEIVGRLESGSGLENERK
jgi:hypothetical protein